MSDQIIEDIPADVIAELEWQHALESRQLAYKTELDPLSMEYTRKAADTTRYTSKEVEAARIAVANKAHEIKSRYPMPESLNE